MDNQEEVMLLKNTYHQAKCLLEEFGEFFPFAMGINSDLQLFNINTFSGNENPEILEHIEELIKTVGVSIKDNNLFAVTVCANVRIKPPYDNEKLDAIEMRINNRVGDSINYYIPYEIKADTIEFYEVFEEQGQLKIW